MYCHHCGADEPEIRIGNRTFCSACGLPLEDGKEKGISDALPEQPEIKKQSELDRAFKSMSGNLGGTGEETSYKSSDMSMVGVKNEEKSATMPKDLAEPISDQPFVQQQTAADIPIDTAVAVPPATNLPTDFPIVDIPEVTEDRVPTEKENAFKKALEEQIKEELKTTNPIPKQEEQISVKEPETEEKTLKEQIKTEPKISKPKPEPVKKTPTREVGTDEKDVNTVPEDAKEIKPSKVVEPAVKENLPKNPSKEEGEIKSLGAASKLLDILEKNENSRGEKEEKSKLTDTLKGAERLIDILKDVPYDKQTKNSDIKKFFDPNPLAKEKEITSPLDTPEINLDKDDFEKEEQSIAPKINEKKSINNQAPEKILGSENIENKFDKAGSEEDLPDLTKVLESYNYSENEEDPASVNDVKTTADEDTLGKSEEDSKDLTDIFADHKPTDQEAGVEDIKEPESHDFDPKDIKIEAENFEEPDVEKPTDNTPEIPVDPVDIVTDWKNEDEDFENFQEKGDNGEEEPSNTDKNELLGDQETNTPTKEDSGDKEKEINGIHGLGDKKGHIDHWPEEEVVKIDAGDLKEKSDREHPLTSYFKEMLEKKEEKKPNKSKKKKDKKKKNHKSLKIIFAFIISLGIISGGVFAVSKIPKKDFQTEKDKATQVLNFQFKEPGYLPVGYIGSLPILSDSSSIEIPYTHVTDSSKQIRVKESAVFLTEDEILKQFVNKNSSDFTTEVLGKTKIYYYGDNAIFTKDKLVIFINASFKIDKSELKKIAESML